jgi:hypothetical protein
MIPNYYKCKYFQPYELVSKDVYYKFGDNSIWFIDVRILITLDNIKEYFGIDKSIIVNNWYWDKKLQFRGFRPIDCKEGSEYSQHKFGRAVDFNIIGLNDNDVRKEIIKNQHIPSFKYITTMEDFTDMNWIHIDCRTRPEKGITVFKL